MEECIICFEDCTDFIAFPCHHKVCALCYPKLKRCPLCNIDIEVHQIHQDQVHEISENEQAQPFYYINVRIVCYLVILILFVLFITRSFTI